jgi:folate-dependent phosphoribosylglycinamide formyltransferase PurN
MANRCKTAILISGSGTNLQAFIDAVESGDLDLDLTVVCSNNPNAFGQHASSIPISLIASHLTRRSLQNWIDSNRIS